AHPSRGATKRHGRKRGVEIGCQRLCAPLPFAGSSSREQTARTSELQLPLRVVRPFPILYAQRFSIHAEEPLNIMSTAPNKIIYSMIGVGKFYDKKPIINDIYL